MKTFHVEDTCVFLSEFTIARIRRPTLHVFFFLIRRKTRRCITVQSTVMVMRRLFLGWPSFWLLNPLIFHQAPPSFQPSSTKTEEYNGTLCFFLCRRLRSSLCASLSLGMYIYIRWPEMTSMLDHFYGILHLLCGAVRSPCTEVSRRTKYSYKGKKPLGRWPEMHLTLQHLLGCLWHISFYL